MWKRLETNEIVACCRTASAKRRVTRLNPKPPRAYHGGWAPDTYYRPEIVQTRTNKRKSSIFGRSIRVTRVVRFAVSYRV